MKRISLIAVAFAIAIGVWGVNVSNVRAASDTCTWVGSAGDGKFSTAANWKCNVNTVPGAGDIIRFDTIPTVDTTLINDLSVDLGGVLVLAQSSSAISKRPYSIDKISLVDGASVGIEKAGVCFPSYPKVAFTNVDAKGSLSYDARTSAYGAPSKIVVSGDLTLTSGSGFNFFSAGSSAANIIVASASPITTAVDCQGGAGGVGPEVRDDFANFTYGKLTVQKGASVQLTNYDKPMVLGGGSATTNPVVMFYSNWDANYNAVATSFAWSGPVTLLSDATVQVGELATVNYTGAISGSFSVSKDVYSAGVFNFNPSSNTTNTNPGTLSNPVKVTNLEGSVNDWVSVVDNETAVLTGVRRGATVYLGGILKGTGTISEGLFVNRGGFVAPGMSPGCLTVGTLTLNGDYQFEIGGVAPCTQYDQIKVTTTGVSYATVNLGSESTISTSRFNNYTPKQGEIYVVIDNQSDQPVQGTFKDLAEGATFEQNGIVFKVSYVGGDGNDVTLTVMNQPTAPDTGFALLSSNPVVTGLLAMFAVVVLLFIGRKLQSSRR